MNVPKTIEQNGQRVLTTAQLAEAYGTSCDTIRQNFKRNKSRYQEGKHYYHLSGAEVREFKSNMTNCHVAKNINSVTLWTERGALLHAKSLNTDKAWEVYDFLVEHYFRAVTMEDAMDLAADAMLDHIKASRRQQIGELRRYHELACDASIAKAQAELAQCQLMEYLMQHPGLAELVSIPALEKQGAKT